jgi:predicted nucleic-acid-binding Zn-ribbon protein
MSDKEKFEARLKRSAGLPSASGEYGQLDPVDQLEPCPKCNGEVVGAKVMETYLMPLKYDILFDIKTSRMEARVCTNCGYTEFYAKDPLKLVVKRPDTKLE